MPTLRTIPLRSSVVSILFTGSLAALPLALLVLAGHSLECGDTVRLYATHRKEVVEALWELRLPLWNPYEGLGMPLFAQMIHGVLHPVNLVMALFVPKASLDVLIIVHIALAAGGSASLARVIGASQTASAVTGFSYALCGYVLSMSANILYLTAAATVPWAVASVGIAGDRGKGWIILGSVLVAASWFGGDPQWTFVGLMLGGALALERAGWRGLLRVSGAAIIGTSLAAVQLVPTLALLDNTMRSLGLAAEERMQWALSPWRLLEFAAPGFFSGRPGTELVSPVFRALGGAQQWFFVPFTASVHVGIVVIVLGVFGFRTGRKGMVLSVASLLFLWLALGMSLGADQLVRHLPIWGSFRYPEKLVGPFTLCVSVLAGLGTDQARALMERWKLIALAALTILAITIVLWLSEGHWLPPGPIAADAAQAARENLAIGLLLSSLSLAALAVIFGMALRQKLMEARLPGLIAGLVFLTSTAAAPFALHLGTRGTVDTTTIRQILPGSDFVRLIQPVNATEGDGPASMDKSERLQVMESRMAIPSYNVMNRLDTYGVYTGLMPRRYSEVDGGLDYVLGDWRLQAIRRFACTHLIVPERRHESMNKTVRIAVQGGMQLATPSGSGVQAWEVPHRPWAFFAKEVRGAETEEQARQFFIESISLMQNDVIVEGVATGTLSGGRILSSQRHGESIVIDAESTGPGLLVINDAWWPGWQATIDGHPAVVRRADALVRAIEWPPGRHHMVMRYEPSEFRYGLLISFAALLSAVFYMRWQALSARASRKIQDGPG
jgi:hypothetical protein